MRFFVVMAITAAVAAYGPPPSTSGASGCGSGCGSTGGGSQVVTTHVSPCPGGNCGGSSVSGGSSPSGDYWWQGQDNPFALPGGQPSSGSSSCSGPGCPSGGSGCAGGGCPSPSRPAPGRTPGTAPVSVQNLVIPPMGICNIGFVCVHWQLCRNGFVIADGSGIIDKQKKVIPPHLVATYDSCGGDMLCCGVPQRPIDQSGSGTFILPHTPGTSHSPSPGTPSRPPTLISPPKFSGSGTPVSPPKFPGSGTSVSPPKFSGSGTPVSPPKFPGSGTPVSPPKFPGSGTPVSPPKFSGSGTSVSRPKTPGSSTHTRPSTTFSVPATPARPPKVSGAGTLPLPQTPVSQTKFSGPATPSRPSPQSSGGSPSYGYPSPGVQQPAGPSPLPSTVNQARPVLPSQPLRPVSNPVGLTSPNSGQPGPMGGMMGMMGMMPPRSGSCSAGTYCVPQQQCNPYTGFIMRGNTQVMAVWPDSPTVPLLPCFVPDGSISGGVCCQESHPNAGGLD